MRLSDSVTFSVYRKILLQMILNIFGKMSQKCEQFSYEGFFGISVNFRDFCGPKWSPPSPASMSKFPSGGKKVWNKCFFNDSYEHLENMVQKWLSRVAFVGSGGALCTKMIKSGPQHILLKYEYRPGPRRKLFALILFHPPWNVEIGRVHSSAHASRGRLQAQASRDGVAAKHAERAKRRRYEGLPITPFVLEIGGRPGEAAVGVVRALAARAVGDASREAATLWQKISIALQIGVGRTIACGLVAPGAVSAAGAA